MRVALPAGSVRRSVTDQLRTALITGRLKPGQRYSAPELGREFGVSPTPVREAMLEFVRLGMVTVEANAGFRVVEPSQKQLDDLLEVRLLIEVPIMGAVAEACGGEVAREVEGLRPLARDLINAALEGDLERYIADDVEFHELFLGLHGNSRLTALASDLRRSSRLYGIPALTGSDVLTRTTKEHEEMIDIALRRDRPAMESLMTRHLSHTRGVWADAFEDSLDARLELHEVSGDDD